MTGLLLALLLVQVPAASQNQNGTLTGQVLQMDEKPAAGVRIAAMPVPEANAPSVPGELASITETDAEGRYRLENLPPGRYYVIAGLLDFPTYYPGATDASTARVVEVIASRTIANMDFSLRRSAAVNVTGRLIGIPNPLLMTVTMISAAGTSTVTAARADGTFEFPKVTPGSYSLRSPGAAPMSLVIEDKDIHIELRPLYTGPGVKVRGRVIGASNLEALPGGGKAAVVLGRIADSTAAGAGAGGGGTNSSSPQAVIQPDGTFEFPRIAAGAYNVLTTPSFSGDQRMTRIEVFDKDLTDIEIRVPFQLRISGRIVVENGGTVPSARLHFANGNRAYLADNLPDGRFTIRVAEGENKAALAELPPGYVVKSITHGNTDLLRGPLKVDPSTESREVVVTLGTVSLESIPGVRVSGRVSPPAERSRVVLWSSKPEPPLTVTPNPDGTFEFLKVLPGQYGLSLSGPFLSSQSVELTVADRDVTNLTLASPALTTVTGRVSARDTAGNPLPALPGTLRITLRGRDLTLTTPVRQDGTISLKVPEGEYAVLLADDLPEGYTIRSITSGPIDLKTAALKVTSAAPPADLRLTLERK